MRKMWRAACVHVPCAPLPTCSVLLSFIVCIFVPCVRHMINCPSTKMRYLNAAHALLKCCPPFQMRRSLLPPFKTALLNAA